ncbi:MAG: metal-dependent hydrolase [Aquabacterium sp.]
MSISELHAVAHPAIDPPAVTPREGLDFDLEGDIPRHWLDGDVFKTRFFDAMSTIFPQGERFFIACVRDYKDQIDDPAIQQLMLDFARQEAQHSKVHMAFNKRLAEQGVKVDRILENQRRQLFDIARKRFSRRYTLALTAASEHLTAVMAEGFMDNKALFGNADPRLRAMYVWHGIEEIEHKAVAFDVMQQVAHVGYWMRVWALIVVSLQFPFVTFQVLNHMLKVDGHHSRLARARIWLKGLRWLYGPGGLMLPLLKPYLAWYKPGFHPWQQALPQGFEHWLQIMNRTGDPIQACNAIQQPPASA